METISTLIEFAEKSNPQGNVTATGDFINVAIILAAVVFAIGSFIFVRMQNKSLVTGKHVVKSTTKNPLTTIFVILAGLLLAVGLISNVSNAIAGPEGIASATEKVYAYVDTETGEVSFENGYIKSNVPQDVNSVAVDVDLLDSAELTYNFNWQVKIGDEVIYNGVAQDLKHDFYIDVKDAQTSFEITNLSVSDANALIGKEVAKISFCATTLKKVQSDSYFVIYDEVKDALADISEIPETSLLEEDRAATNASISQILDTCLADISTTEDPAQLQIIVNSLKSQITDLVNDAKVTAEQTVADKQAFIAAKSASATNLKTTVTNSDLLTAADKVEFNSQIDVLALQDIPYINSITSKVELEAKEADISERLDTLDASIKARIEQRFVEYKENAVVIVNQKVATGSASIESIENLTSSTKSNFVSAIQQQAATIIPTISAAKTVDEIDGIIESFQSFIDGQIEDAESIAYRVWTVDPWDPAPSHSVIGKDVLLDRVAEVGLLDPFVDDAPKPTYHIVSTSENASYFSFSTNEDLLPRLSTDASAPIGHYELQVYAEFASVPDKGYVTQTDVTWLYIDVVQPSEEIVLVQPEQPYIADDWYDQPYVLSDGGTELMEAGAQAKMYVNFYLQKMSSATLPTDFWILEIMEGHWGGTYSNICEETYVPGPEEAKRVNYDLSKHGGVYSLYLTSGMLETAYTQQWWGGTFILNGDNTQCSKITLTNYAY